MSRRVHSGVTARRLTPHCSGLIVSRCAPSSSPLNSISLGGRNRVLHASMLGARSAADSCCIRDRPRSSSSVCGAPIAWPPPRTSRSRRPPAIASHVDTTHVSWPSASRAQASFRMVVSRRDRAAAASTERRSMSFMQRSVRRALARRFTRRSATQASSVARTSGLRSMLVRPCIGSRLRISRRRRAIRGPVGRRRLTPHCSGLGVSRCAPSFSPLNSISLAGFNRHVLRVAPSDTLFVTSCGRAVYIRLHLPGLRPVLARIMSARPHFADLRSAADARHYVRVPQCIALRGIYRSLRRVFRSAGVPLRADWRRSSTYPTSSFSERRAETHVVWQRLTVAPASEGSTLRESGTLSSMQRHIHRPVSHLLDRARWICRVRSRARVRSSAGTVGAA